MVFAIEDSPVAMMGAFDGIVAWAEQQPKVQAAFQAGAASHGATMALACSVPLRGSSDPATFITSYRIGYRLSMGWLPNCGMAQRSQMSDVAMVGPR